MWQLQVISLQLQLQGFGNQVSHKLRPQSDHGSASSSGSGISGTQSISSPKSGSGESDVKILPSEAKSIVQQNILIPDFKAGTPNLTTLDGKIVYYVPIVNGTTQAGEMYIDAQTGDILEGAGGVDNGSNG